MSTDGGGTADAARSLAGRLRAAAAERTRRSGALIRSRLAGEAAPAAATLAAASAPPLLAGADPLPPDDAAAQPALPSGAPGTSGAAHASAPAAGSTAAEPPGGNGDGADRRLGPAILRAADQHVPMPLRTAAAWAWRLLLIAAIVYLSFKVAVALRLLVLPFIAAVLLCALLQPLVGRLSRAGLPRLAATWVTLLVAIVILAGVGILIANQVQAGYPRLSAEVVHTVHDVKQYLAGPPFRLNGKDFNQLSNKLLNYLEQHKTVVAGTVLTGGKYFIELLTGIILTIFITFFLLKDGDFLWSRLVRGFTRFRGAGPDALDRADRASAAAWHALVRYIHGTTIIAMIHAVLIGIALWLLGVPLVMPIAILVFLAAYVPLVGILVVGAVAILVTLATQGWLAAVILLAVFLAENQLESHLLQPLVIGRAVRLHPLEVIIVLAVGGIVAGIPGAIVAVPTAAVVSAAWRSSHEPRRHRDQSADAPRAGRGGRNSGRDRDKQDVQT
ncbi:MAG TPA: AI-2E family transporter [Streptosporangiaceae bacterium]|nr:AI-2E family transporter [Streptosporangiaceae bacterium]